MLCLADQSACQKASRSMYASCNQQHRIRSLHPWFRRLCCTRRCCCSCYKHLLAAIHTMYAYTAVLSQHRAPIQQAPITKLAGGNTATWHPTGALWAFTIQHLQPSSTLAKTCMGASPNQMPPSAARAPSARLRFTHAAVINAQRLGSACQQWDRRIGSASKAWARSSKQREQQSSGINCESDLGCWVGCDWLRSTHPHTQKN